MWTLKGGEYGFLLLTSHLGNPDRKPLTVAQFRELLHRAGSLSVQNPDRDMDAEDFVAMGYGISQAQRIVELLHERELLDWYLKRAEKSGCFPITRATECYPLILRKRLGTDCPGVLWARGDLSVLETPAVSLVGSRELRAENRAFAQRVGCLAAERGLTLVSGNARGADQTAQNACRNAGGKVISVVADSLLSHEPKKNLLYLSENAFDEEFSAPRALSRNRIIHALGRITFVAQSSLERGGTWDGTVKNLRHGWSPAVCFRDGSEASVQLEQLGAYLCDMDELEEFIAFSPAELNFLDR